MACGHSVHGVPRCDASKRRDKMSALLSSYGAMYTHTNLQKWQDQVSAWQAGTDQAKPKPTNGILDDAGVFTETHVQVLEEPSADILHMREVYADLMATGGHAGH